MNMSDQDNASTDGYQESFAQHVAPDDQFIRAQTDRKLQMQSAAKQAFAQLEPLLKDQQNFGWLDNAIEQYRYAKDIERQHQADLLRARIDETLQIPPIFGPYASQRRRELQAELDKLEGEK